ncbi:MAG: hypothetical protein M1360_04830 [Candidatus Marsarchaeota archaeon]|jgi:hypothetical protein|nr:hypothetical protein [Candidatus Marsarchaeota archaeon]MCL5419229.1 hypothetical protein [Candidatus Marsarchaeota archaeon]
MKAVYLLLPLLLFSFSFVSYAQLGEQAGQPFFNVSLGSSQTFNYTILNSGSAPIGYQVVLPTLNTIPHNATPTVIVTPMNGTLAPNSQQRISVTVFMPGSDKPYLKWQGVLQVVETATVSNATSGMGATLRAGVAKIVTIESAPSKPLPLIDYVLIIVVVLVVIIIIAYLLVARRNARIAAAAARKRAVAKRVKARIKKAPARKARRRAARKTAARKRRRTRR